MGVLGAYGMNLKATAVFDGVQLLYQVQDMGQCMALVNKAIKPWVLQNVNIS
jgi:hypothetical protein